MLFKCSNVTIPSNRSRIVVRHYPGGGKKEIGHVAKIFGNSGKKPTNLPLVPSAKSSTKPEFLIDVKPITNSKLALFHHDNVKSKQEEFKFHEILHPNAFETIQSKITQHTHFSSSPYYVKNNVAICTQGTLEDSIHHYILMSIRANDTQNNIKISPEVLQLLNYPPSNKLETYIPDKTKPNKPSGAISLTPEQIISYTKRKETLSYALINYTLRMYGHEEIKNIYDIFDRIYLLLRVDKNMKFFGDLPPGYLQGILPYFSLIQHFLSLDTFNQGLSLESMQEFVNNKINFSTYPKDALLPLTTFLEMAVFGIASASQFEHGLPIALFAMNPESEQKMFKNLSHLSQKTIQQNHGDLMGVILNDTKDVIVKIILADIKLTSDPLKCLPLLRSFYSISPYKNDLMYVKRFIGDIGLKNQLVNDPVLDVSLKKISSSISPFLTKDFNVSLLNFQKMRQSLFYDINNKYYLPSAIESAITDDYTSNIFNTMDKTQKEAFIREVAESIDLAIIFPTHEIFDPKLYPTLILNVISKMPKFIREKYFENYYKVRELTDLIDNV